MIKANKFDTKQIKLGDTFKVSEGVFVEEFLPRVLQERSTIVVVDQKGDTKGYITEKQLAAALDKTVANG